MIQKKNKDILINYRLEQAKNTIAEVTVLIKTDLLNVAVNRIYYGIFYSLNALALKYEFQSSKHLQLIGWFNKTFIKSGQIDIKYGRILRDAFKNRSDGDYVPFVSFQKDDILEMQADMTEFITYIDSFIRNKQ